MGISKSDLILENKKLESTIDIIRKEISNLSTDLYDKETKLREFQTMMWDNRAELDAAEMKTLRTSNDLEVFFLEQKAKKFKKLYQIQNKPYFAKLKQLAFDVEQEKYDTVSMDVLSMGMSGDYMAAIEEGATHIRVGTSIFGQRNYTANQQ